MPFTKIHKIMLLNKRLDLSFFSLQLIEYLIENHPHRANDFDFIKHRGDEAAKAFEDALRGGSLQDIALEDAYEELYKGLYYSLHSLIKDVLWTEFAEIIPAHKVEEGARLLYPRLSHLHKQFDPTDIEWGMSKEMELNEVNEEELRAAIVFHIKKIFAEGYGI